MVYRSMFLQYAVSVHDAVTDRTLFVACPSDPARPRSPANEDTPQVYALCGRGPRSSLRVLRHGLEVSEMAVSELPGNPNAVWTVRKRADGTYTD